MERELCVCECGHMINSHYYHELPNGVKLNYCPCWKKNYPFEKCGCINFKKKQEEPKKIIENKFYDNFYGDEKVQLRDKIRQQKDNFSKQKELIETSVIKVLQERVALTEKFLAREIHLQYYIKRQQYLSDYVSKFFKYMGDTNGKEKDMSELP